MANDLARWQFATTTIYHFLFVPVTIGLAFLVAVLQTVWHRTDNPDYKQMTRFFGTLLLINVAVGVFAALLASTDNDGWAFTASGFAIAAAIGEIFIALYPNVMVSSTNHAYNLTVNNSAAGHYGLVVMTVVAVLFFPIVLLYQGWSFHVFRRRVSAPPEPETQPAAPGAAATQT